MTDVERTLEDENEAAADGATPGAEHGAEAAPDAAVQAPEAAERGAAPPRPGSAGGPDDTALRGDFDELVAVAAQRDEYLALAQRTQADFENYKKRVAREAAAAQERGAAALAKELLPALDNLDRALDAAASDDPLLDGVRLVRADLGAALARAGIASYSPLGERFDPSLHEAVATAPQGEDGAQSGTVVEVYQAGYRLGEQVIRPARVLVAA